ncbi:glycosyltransferase WbsX family protein [Pseudobutyrivibrio sp. MD2005]|uniref:glycosyltransferase WbsX family protein n=1 Tax=Pseudobutyrivibrio sp. MD2005 TaxID=1410616 RepID=UPI0006891B17|nr:glycoside hydrolase family 99-like domain-containing protein [Pseudobutyrivibrio sp. MD2005]
MNTKILATYLPQFHKVPENDAWWGNDFTDWIAVKNAEQLVVEQYQPRVPLDENYYDLLDKRVFEWQSNLLHKYQIDGLVFYHYYFANHKKILEKPAENLLRWKEINIPFCFSWANESWVRSWSNLNIPSNRWNPKHDYAHEENGKEILLLQEYGNKKDWKKHFDYLLPFFKDDRYIKVDNKPVFLIWRPEIINVLEQIVDYWQKLAVDSGFEGMYFIATNATKACCDASYFNAPNYLMRYIKPIQKDDGIRNYLYDNFFNLNIDLSKQCEGKNYLGVFPDYDDSPRRGPEGMFVSGCNPEKFKEFFKSSLKYSLEVQNEFLFVNAWNEWGESMYLEPDERYGYKYLQAILDTRKEVEKEDIISVAEEKVLETTVNCCEEPSQLERYKYFWYTYDRWLNYLEQGLSINNFIDYYGYKRIAIYGIGMFARHIIRELPNNTVIYGIDKKAKNNFDSIKSIGFPIMSPDDDLPDVDAVLVTVGYDFESIYNGLKENLDLEVNIHSIEEVFDTLDIILLKGRCE